MKQRRGHKLQEMNAKGSLIYRSGGKRFESIRKPTDLLYVWDFELLFYFFWWSKKGVFGRGWLFTFFFSAVISHGSRYG